MDATEKRIPEVAEKLDGQVVFFAMSAEEYGEMLWFSAVDIAGKSLKTRLDM